MDTSKEEITTQAVEKIKEIIISSLLVDMAKTTYGDRYIEIINHLIETSSKVLMEEAKETLNDEDLIKISESVVDATKIVQESLL